MAVSGSERPRFWIVAGPNGSGKSTAYGQGDVLGLDGSVWIINPDLLTARLEQAEKLDLLSANLAAVQRIELWLEKSIAVHQTIGVETVLSSPKYRRLVEMADRHDFEVCFVYVYLQTAEMQLERIRARVAKGGHNVPENKVRERRARSFEQLHWFYWNSDRAWIFDNSGSEPTLVARHASIAGEGFTGELNDDLLPELRLALYGEGI